MPAARAVYASRTISVIASLTSILTLIGFDGMGQVNGHNADRSILHQGTTYNLPSFSRPKIPGRASQWSSFLGGTSHHACHLCHRDSPGTNSGAIAKNESSETYLSLLEKYLSSAEVAAWNSFKLIVSDFLGNNNSPNYEMIVEDLLQKYARIDSSISTGPVFIAPVGNQTAAIGREIVFSCSVRNLGKYKVGWLRASDQTILSVHTRTVTHNARIAVSYETGGSSGSSAVSGNTFGVTGSSQPTEEVVNGTWRLHIRQLKESDRDCYMCQINTSPMISELGCLDILVPPDIVYGGDTSADLAVSEGDNATLSCRATGRPTPRVSWRREDGEPILIRASSTGGNTFERHDTYNGSLLQFHRVERRQMGAYLCIASNDVPPAVSKRVTLAVNFVPVVKAPNQLLGAPLGTDVQLECYVEAFPNTINYWVKNRRSSENEMLLEGHKYSVREERSGYKVLMWLLIKEFTEQDVGSYKCVSTNSLGKADGTLRLYEIKIGFDRSSRGKDHVSIIGGLAEAAQSSGASNDGKGMFGCVKKLLYCLLIFLFVPVLL